MAELSSTGTEKFTIFSSSSSNNVLASNSNSLGLATSIPNKLPTLNVPHNDSLSRRRSFITKQDDELADDVQFERSISPTNSVWSEIDWLEARRGSHLLPLESSAHANSTISDNVGNHLKMLVNRFSQRTEHFRKSTAEVDTLSIDEIESQLSGINNDPTKILQDLSTPLDDEKPKRMIGWGRLKISLPVNFFGTFEPQSNKLYLAWLSLVALAYLYNIVAITLRAAFHRAYFYNPDTDRPCDEKISNFNEVVNISSTTFGFKNSANAVQIQPCQYYEAIQTDNNLLWWLMVDYICDAIYILDILLVKHRIRFVKGGLAQDDWKCTALNYFHKIDFRLDILSLLPFDLLYLVPVINFNSLCRIPRFLKLHSYTEFWDRLDASAKNAHLVRVVRTLTSMMYLIHIEACLYFLTSAYEGLNKNAWVYNGKGIGYVRCMYLATKTATSIGNNPKPVNRLEYLFMTASWLSGVFVFAMLIGQIRDIFQAASAAKEQYRKSMDAAVLYMQGLGLPMQLQGKVRMWFTYNWETQRTLDENSLVSELPLKMRTDLAIQVHLGTLSKVSLFQDCDKNLLFDLVLKLKPVLFLPSDYICKKGEVGTEMYIIKEGQVQVVGGENDSVVFVTLHEGSVFGEISLMNLAGGNRRTASVRSKGFSNIFILSKEDFEDAMKDYPAAYKLLRRKARRVLTKNTKKTEKDEQVQEVIKPDPGTPKMVKTVLQLMKSNICPQETDTIKCPNNLIVNSLRATEDEENGHAGVTLDNQSGANTTDKHIMTISDGRFQSLTNGNFQTLSECVLQESSTTRRGVNPLEKIKSSINNGLPKLLVSNKISPFVVSELKYSKNEVVNELIGADKKQTIGRIESTDQIAVQCQVRRKGAAKPCGNKVVPRQSLSNSSLTDDGMEVVLCDAEVHRERTSSIDTN